MHSPARSECLHLCTESAVVVEDIARLQRFIRYYTLQNWQKRSHKTRYQIVGEDCTTKSTSVLGREVKVPIKTQLLLTVSNFHFNIEAVKVKRAVTCTPNDCKVSIKFSSDDFVPKDKADSRTYHFDKNAFCVSYSAFLSLLSDRQLETQIWPEVLANYKEATGIDLQAESLAQHLVEPLDIDLPPPPPPPEHQAGGSKRGKAKPSSSKRASKRAKPEHIIYEGDGPATPIPERQVASDENVEDDDDDDDDRYSLDKLVLAKKSKQT